MPRSRARRFPPRRPWRASRALANGSQLAGSHTPRAPTCRKHARRWRASAAIITIDPSARWFKAGRLLLGRTPAGNLLLFQHHWSTLNSLSIPEKVSLADEKVSRDLSTLLSELLSLARRLSIGGSTPTCACACVCVCAGRKSVEHGRAYEVHPGRDSA